MLPETETDVTVSQQPVVTQDASGQSARTFCIYISPINLRSCEECRLSQKSHWSDRRHQCRRDQHTIVCGASKSRGVILDSQLTMNSHVAAVYKACYFHIQSLQYIRCSAGWRHKDDRMQHCRFLSWLLQLTVYRDAQTIFAKPQSAEHSCMRASWVATREATISLWFGLTVTGCQSSPGWCSRLHRWHAAFASWNNRRISGCWFQIYKPTCDLRSSSHDLIVSKTTKSKGARAYSCDAASNWKSLRLTLRHFDSVETFQKHLKTGIHRTFC